jgi:hypothetical protein
MSRIGRLERVDEQTDCGPPLRETIMNRRTFALSFLVLALAACASRSSSTAVGIQGLPSIIRVSEWPFWIEIPLGTTDYARIWRTTLDVVSERHAIAVMDKEGGYLRTEWKATPDQSQESRYTMRVKPSDAKIRMGVEVRSMKSGEFLRDLYNRPDSPWASVYKELQSRLVDVAGAASGTP